MSYVYYATALGFDRNGLDCVNVIVSLLIIVVSAIQQTDQKEHVM